MPRVFSQLLNQVPHQPTRSAGFNSFPDRKDMTILGAHALRCHLSHFLSKEKSAKYRFCKFIVSVQHLIARIMTSMHHVTPYSFGILLDKTVQLIVIS